MPRYPPFVGKSGQPEQGLRIAGIDPRTVRRIGDGVEEVGDRDRVGPVERVVLGLTIARHFLRLDAFADASDADIARVARPWVTTGVEPASGAAPPSDGGTAP
jgi:hypothetical protein